MFRLFISLSILYVSESAEDSLKLVHIFTRHGCRTPIQNEVYPNDPYTADKDFRPGYGMLTQRGKEESYKLGQQLRSRYGSFLGVDYSPDLFEAHTTDRDRTKMTLLCVLAGLFPPGEDKKYGLNIGWQPFPYNYLPHEHDHILTDPEYYCPVYKDELQSIHNSEVNKELLEEYTETIEYISNNTGRNYTSVKDLYDLFQVLNAEEHLNLALPEWTNSIYPSPLEQLAVKRLIYKSNNAVMKKFFGGKILRMVYRHLQKKIAKDTLVDKKKLYMYSVHDITIHAILAALNLADHRIPPYNSAILVELHHIPENDHHAVKILYIDGVGAIAEEKKLSDCEVLCPIHNFERIMKPHFPINVTQECTSKIDLEIFDI